MKPKTTNMKFKTLINTWTKNEVTQEEMYYMTPNVFSISPEVVVIEENFKRLAEQFKEWGIQPEPIPYFEVSKMGGLLRCSTMPLIREA